MKITQFKYLITVLALTLIGLIGLQLYWLFSDYTNKQEQLLINANQALQATINKFENIEANQFLKFSETDADTVLNKLNEDIGTFSIDVDKENNKQSIKISSSGDPKDSGSFTQTIVIQGDSGTRTKTSVMSKAQKFSLMFKKKMFEFINKSGNIEQRVNKKLLEETLKEELTNRGIKLGYQYKIESDCDTSTNNVNNEKLQVSAKLFPNDILPHPSYLVLQFENTRSYILQSILVQVSLSIFFTLVLIGVFYYTIIELFRQKKLGQIKNDFINNMTHEFKTPIATISLASDALSNPIISGSPEKVTHYLGIIKQENKRLNEHVEKVLQLSLSEKGELVIKKEEINLAEVIEKAIKQTQLQLQAKRGIIDLKLHSGEIPFIGDAFHLQNMMVNLIDNAIKYCNQEPFITIQTKSQNGEIKLSVADNGLGIGKQDAKRIFEKFFRVNTGNKHDVKGFGIGLSYVKDIVERHQGEINIDSEINKGTTFYINFKHAKI